MSIDRLRPRVSPASRLSTSHAVPMSIDRLPRNSPSSRSVPMLLDSPPPPPSFRRRGRSDGHTPSNSGPSPMAIDPTPPPSLLLSLRSSLPDALTAVSNALRPRDTSLPLSRRSRGVVSPEPSIPSIPHPHLPPPSILPTNPPPSPIPFISSSASNFLPPLSPSPSHSRKRSRALDADTPSASPSRRPHLSITPLLLPVASSPPTATLPPPPFPYSGRKRAHAIPTRPSPKKAKPTPPTPSSKRKPTRGPYGLPLPAPFASLPPATRRVQRVHRPPQPFWLPQPPAPPPQPPPHPPALGPVAASRSPRPRRGALQAAAQAEGRQE
jgi:hypothetical protein